MLWSTHRQKDETAYRDTENRNVFGIFLRKGIDSIYRMYYNKEKGGMEK